VRLIQISLLALTLAAMAAPALAQDATTTLEPSSIALTLANGEQAVRSVSYTFHPFCFRPLEIDVVASSADAIIENLTGVLVNGCGGDESEFSVRFTGTGESQSFTLDFVDAEFGGTLGSIPVTVNGGSSEPPPVRTIESAGEAGPLLACFYDCSEVPGAGVAWREASSLKIANTSSDDRLAQLTFLDGNQNIVAFSRIALASDDIDEINVCSTLARTSSGAPKTGLAYVEGDLGVYAWTKTYRGHHLKSEPELGRGRLLGVGETECRIVPPSVRSGADLRAKIATERPPEIPSVMINDTSD